MSIYKCANVSEDKNLDKHETRRNTTLCKIHTDFNIVYYGHTQPIQRHNTIYEVTAEK
jgi:hypothetical protein